MKIFKINIIPAFLVFLSTLVSNSLYGQSIYGQIVDDSGKGIPYASVFIKEITLGVAANEQGKFNIKIAPGEYKIVFQSLGYSPESRNVVVTDKSLEINVSLKTRHYDIEGVTFSLKSEDPAYGIMRRAIGLAPYHSKQVKTYNAQVYIKGKVNVMKLSRLVKRMIRKEEDAPKEGEIYVHESNNELLFKAPNTYEQKVLSTRNTFPGNDNNNPMDFIALNLYQPTFESMILPLAPNAFVHYKFKYLGTAADSERLIHKIEVIPRKKGQQFLSGTIYIVDDLYCIHSADLRGAFMAGSFHFSTQFAPLGRNLWMPISHNIDIAIKMMGNNAEVNYLASVSYKSIESNDKFSPSYSETKTAEKPISKAKPPTPKQEKQQKKIETIMQKGELTNKDMHQLSKLMKEQQKDEPDTIKSLEIKRSNNVTVDSLASKRDSSYWEQLRPIPLSVDEVKSFQKKDSLIRLAGPDSLQKKSVPSYLKKKSLARVAFSGGRFAPKKSTWSFSSEGLNPTSYYYNTVDGLVPKYVFTVGKRIKKKSFSLSNSFSYAISRNELMYSGSFGFPYSPLRRGRAGIAFGSLSKDFNSSDAVNTFVNSISTLAFKENFAKLYQEQWVSISNGIDLANGLVLNTNAKIFNRSELTNTTNFAFFYGDTKPFTPNIPNNMLYGSTPKSINLGTSFNLGLTYTPEYYYRMYGQNKRMVRSRYPTFLFNYNLYSYWVGDRSTVHKVNLGLYQEKKWELFHELYYSFNVGKFFNANNLHFADFKHFNTQPLPLVLDASPSSFCLLPYYSHSTNNYWAEAHLRYQSPFMALKFLPLVSELNMNEAIFFGAFATKQTPYYLELGYGFSEILQFMSISGHIGYMHTGDILYGFRIGFAGNTIGL
jgi:uncharacterized membrane protein YciS (DUF1049 family)